MLPASLTQLDPGYATVAGVEGHAVVTLERETTRVEIETLGSAPAISVRGLRKSFGSLEAVRGLDFDVRAGEIFALVGPNGAGKTTTVDILEGYGARDAGTVLVLGVDQARRRGRGGAGSASCCRRVSFLRS